MNNFQKALDKYSATKLINPRKSAESFQALANQGSFAAAFSAGLLNYEADKADRQEARFEALLQGRQDSRQERTTDSNVANTDANTDLTEKKVNSYDEDRELANALTIAKTNGVISDTQYQNQVNRIHAKYAGTEKEAEINTLLAGTKLTEARTKDIPIGRAIQRETLAQDQKQFETSTDISKDQFNRTLSNKKSEFKSEFGLATDKHNFDKSTDARNFKRRNLESDRTFDRGVLESDRIYDRGIVESDRVYNRGILEYDLDRKDTNIQRGIVNRQNSQKIGLEGQRLRQNAFQFGVDDDYRNRKLDSDIKFENINTGIRKQNANTSRISANASALNAQTNAAGDSGIGGASGIGSGNPKSLVQKNISLLKDFGREFGRQPLLGFDSTKKLINSDRYTSSERSFLNSLFPEDTGDDEDVNKRLKDTIFKLGRF